MYLVLFEVLGAMRRLGNSIKSHAYAAHFTDTSQALIEKKSTSITGLRDRVKTKFHFGRL